MEENYFDKKLKDILENPPQFSPSPKALEDIQNRLTKAQQPRRKGMPLLFWLLPLASLPFIFSTIFFYNKYESLNTKLEQISTQLTNNQTIKNEIVRTTYQYDTIYRTLYKNVYKDVYKDVIIEQKIEKSGKEQFYYQNASFINYKNNTTSLLGYSLPNLNNAKNNFSPFSNQFFYHNKNSFIENLRENQSISSEEEPTNNLQILKGLQFPELSLLHKNKDLELTDKLSKVDPVLKSNRTKAIYYFIPKGLSLGGTYSPFAFSNALNGISGFSFGLNANIHFPKNVQMQIGLERLSLGYKVDNPTNTANLPIVNPDDPNDLLAELYGDFTYLQVPIIFKYNFPTKKKWKPSIGMGMVAKMPLKQKFKYEYVNTVIGEYKLETSFSDGIFSVKNLRTTIGLDYDIFQKWTIGVEFNYQYSFEQAAEEYFKLNYWNGNMSLKYDF